MSNDHEERVLAVVVSALRQARDRTAQSMTELEEDGITEGDADSRARYQLWRRLRYRWECLDKRIHKTI